MYVCMNAYAYIYMYNIVSLAIDLLAIRLKQGIAELVKGISYE